MSSIISTDADTFTVTVAINFTGSQSQQSANGSMSASATEAGTQSDVGGDNFDAQGSQQGTGNSQPGTVSDMSDTASFDAFQDQDKELASSTMSVSAPSMSNSMASNDKGLSADIGADLTDDQQITASGGGKAPGNSQGTPTTTETTVDDATDTYSDTTRHHDESTTSLPIGGGHSHNDGNSQLAGSTSDDATNGDDEFDHTQDSKQLSVRHTDSTTLSGYSLYDDTNTDLTDFTGIGDDSPNRTYDWAKLVYDMQYNDNGHTYSVDTLTGSWNSATWSEVDTDDEVGGTDESASQPGANGTTAIEVVSHDFSENWETYTPYYGLQQGGESSDTSDTQTDDIGDGAGGKDTTASGSTPGSAGVAPEDEERFAAQAGMAVEEFRAAQNAVWLQNAAIVANNSGTGTWAELGSTVWSETAMYPGNVARTGKGYFWNGPKAMIVGVGSMVAHPVDTAAALGKAAADPVGTGKALVQHYKQLAQTNEGQGQIGFDVATIVTPTGLAKLDKLRQAARAGQIASGANLVSRFGSAGQREALLARVGEARTLSEAKGLVSAFREMKGLGYELEDVALHYRGNQGLDLVFSKAGGYAIVEAKHGASLSALKIYAGGLRQGGLGYNISRLQRYLDFGDGTFDTLVNQLMNEAAAGNLESFATFYRSGRTYELPLGWPAVPAVPR